MGREFRRSGSKIAALAKALTWALILAGASAQLARADGDRHTLWSVKGQTNTVYLLGSVHVLRSDDRDLPPESLRAYAQATSLVMELDLNDATPDKLLAGGGLSDETLPEGQTLASVLGPAAYATLVTHLQPLGLDPGFFGQMQPWFVAVMLEQLEMARLGFDPDSGVEAQFTRRAQADHKPIIALETMDEQLGLFSHMSLEQQRRFLLYSLEDADDAAQEMNAVVTAWRRGDTAALEALLGEGFDKFPDLYRILTTDRNRKWLPKIEGLLHEKCDYLVIVGALHLVGRDGVVALLEREGYKVLQR
ncbi:MAG: TraB/GumN family protein [Steroidobacterales bacterium]